MATAGARGACARGCGGCHARLAFRRLVLVLFLDEVDFHRCRGLHHHPDRVVGTRPARLEPRVHDRSLLLRWFFLLRRRGVRCFSLAAAGSLKTIHGRNVTNARVNQKEDTAGKLLLTYLEPLSSATQLCPFCQHQVCQRSPCNQLFRSSLPCTAASREAVGLHRSFPRTAQYLSGTCGTNWTYPSLRCGSS